MHGAQNVNFEKSAWMNPEAAERMSQYAKTADELVETEHFGAWPSVTVGKEQFAMVPKTAAVANIIDTHGETSREEPQRPVSSCNYPKARTKSSLAGCTRARITSWIAATTSCPR